MRERLFSLIKSAAKRALTQIGVDALVHGIKKFVKDKVYTPIMRKISKTYDDLGKYDKNFRMEM